MKSQKGLKAGIAVLTAILALSFFGCPMNSGEEDEKNGAAVISAISVADVTVASLPDPVSHSNWTSDGFSLFDLEANQQGQVVINQSSDLVNAQIDVTASAGASVKYAAASFDAPQTFQDENTLTLSNNGYLCIQVTSEDGKTINYYVVEIKLMNALTSLTGISVAGTTATLGTPNAAWDQAVAGAVSLSNATKTNAAISVTRSNANQTVKYAKVTGGGAPSFVDTAAFSFEDGDFLYIEVTAENGVNKNVYKVEIRIGRDTTLATLSIGGTSITNRGTPAATADGVTAAGTVLFNTAQPAGGYAINAVSEDTEATVTWATTAGGTYGTVSPIVFTDGGFLYVKVVSANGNVTAYYKIQVNLMMTGTIKYGQPEIKASSEKYIDSIWSTPGIETYNITKIYPNDSSSSYIANPNTTGVAKALFDASGLYLYVEVTDPAVDTTGTSAHTKDSVELFINEGVNASGDLIKTPVSYVSKGGQYRVDADGVISGDPGDAASAMNPSKVSAWTTSTGYIVIFQAPWRFLEQYPVAQGKKIGFEIQINACSSGGRDGVMVWNNIAHTNYQNVSDYGEAALDLDGHSLAVNAKNPTISAHPASAVYTGGASAATPLTVTAASPDGGTLTYQWYSNTVTGYAGGTAITNETTASYTPNISADGTTYYWVTVTNTIADNSDGGTKTATLQSGIASIVVSSVPLVEKVQAGGSSVPAYRFTPPAGTTWSDYTSISFQVMVADNASYTETAARAHIMGNYQASNFSATGANSVMQDWNIARLVTISNGGTLSNIIGNPGLYTWKELSYSIAVNNPQVDGAYAGDTYYPAAEATGPFYFGIGFTVNPNSAAERTVTYYIKNVALVNTEGIKLPADDFSITFNNTTLGQLRCMFSNVAGAVVNRTMEPEPVAPPSGD
jgi:hypothetical protein